jgi:hypothetical protein
VKNHHYYYSTVLETPHVVVGAAIATKIANPLIAIPLALGSHFVLEKVPHWNPHLTTEKKKYGKVTKKSTQTVILDASTALILGGLIASRALPNTQHAITILLSCFAAVLPDVVEAPYFFLNSKNKFIQRWIVLQKKLQSDTSIVPGLATQFITVVAAFWWIFG